MASIESLTRVGAVDPANKLRLMLTYPKSVGRNFDEILRESYAIMIARGDLAVELGSVRMAEMQEEILWLCEAAQVPVIWATQVLETMAKDGAISRVHGYIHLLG